MTKPTTLLAFDHDEPKHLDALEGYIEVAEDEEVNSRPTSQPTADEDRSAPAGRWRRFGLHPQDNRGHRTMRAYTDIEEARTVAAKWQQKGYDTKINVQNGYYVIEMHKVTANDSEASQ